MIIGMTLRNLQRFILIGALLTIAGPTTPVPVAIAATCTAAQGQGLIDQGRYDQAIRVFGCVIDAQPAGVEGYRGRIEAEVLLSRYSDAVQDYQRVAAYVLPVHPDGLLTIHAGYAARLVAAPNDIRALTGASFARWWDFDYGRAARLLDRLLDAQPGSPYGLLMRGSSRLLGSGPNDSGVADLEQAIHLDPANPHVRFIVADAYTYGLPDPERAFAEASLAQEMGLDTPRIVAMLGAAYAAFGEVEAAAIQYARHIDMVTNDVVASGPLAPGGSLSLDLVPGRTYEIAVTVTAGETLSIATSSHDMWDTIAVLLAPDGTPIVGSDDANAYMAALDWVAPSTATYRLRVTSFESVSTGTLIVTRD